MRIALSILLLLVVLLAIFGTAPRSLVAQSPDATGRSSIVNRPAFDAPFATEVAHISADGRRFGVQRPYPYSVLQFYKVGNAIPLHTIPAPALAIECAYANGYNYKCEFSDFVLSSNGHYAVAVAQVSDAGEFGWIPSARALYRYSPNGTFEIFPIEEAARGLNDTPAISDDGNRVAWARTLSSTIHEVYLYDFTTGRVRLVSQGMEQAPANGISGAPSLTPDGRYLFFVSEASNLVEGDTNGVADIFRYDVETEQLILVSRGTGGVLANAAPSGEDSFAIDGSGNRLVWATEASNLDDSTTPYAALFLRDIDADTTTRIVLAPDGTPANATSLQPSLSLDGQSLAFVSDATNLVPQDVNGYRDAFRMELSTGDIEQVSVTNRGVPASDGATTYAELSGDGATVLLESDASLQRSDIGGADIYLYDARHQIFRVNEEPPKAFAGAPSFSTTNAMSGDGRYSVYSSTAINLVTTPFPNDGAGDVYGYLYDNLTRRTERLTFSANGIIIDAPIHSLSIAANGEFISAIVLNADGTRYDAWRINRETREGTIASTSANGAFANGSAWKSGISDDGRIVVFSAIATNLVNLGNGCDVCYQVYAKDMNTGAIELVSVSADGNGGNQDSNDDMFYYRSPDLTPDGTIVAFTSYATNLVLADTNARSDVFVRNLVTREMQRVSIASDGTQANGNSYGVSISDNGRYVTFSSEASNLVANDQNDGQDFFMHDMVTGETVLLSLDPNGSSLEDTRATGVISGDGNTVFIYTNIAMVPGSAMGFNLYGQDLRTHETWLIPPLPEGNVVPNSTGASIYGLTSNYDGRVVTFAWAFYEPTPYYEGIGVFQYDYNASPLSHTLFAPLMMQ